MNVFVLCTGRCGSTTFAESAAHATNFTAGHETRRRKVGEARMTFPDRHIEVDNRLSWFLGQIDARYGNDAYYVHLQRDRDAVVKSFAGRTGSQLMLAFARGLLQMKPDDVKNASRDELAADLVDTITTNIRWFLRNKKNVMEFRMETGGEQFPEFWKWIGAQGDLDAAVAEWDVRHNRS